MLLGITHMAVTGQQLVDYDAVMLAIDTGATQDLVGKCEWFSHIFKI